VGLGPLLTASEFLRAEVGASGVGGLSVLPLGLPPDMEAAARDAVPRPRAHGEPLRIVCTSSLWAGKGQDVLIEAVALARAAGAPLAVDLAGGGVPAYRAGLERLARERGVGELTRFHGRLGRAETSALLRRAHVLAMPSVWGEPFGLATLEGMAHGLAVVASDAGASPELVPDGAAGRLFPAGDARALVALLTELAADDALRLRLAAAGRERVAEVYGHARFVDGLERALARARGEG
jgi:glycosyltransferase involved in cell wall biosynthesis